MLNVNEIFTAFQIGVFAYVFVCVLMEPKNIFELYGDLLAELNNKHPYLARPLGYCELCFSGQLSLWYFIFTLKFKTLFVGFYFFVPTEYSFTKHILFVSFSILFTKAIKQLLK
jgi:hypothetical protein